MSNAEYVIFNPKKRTKLESLFSNFVFLIMFSFLVYISQDSTFWTFISGSLFLIILFSKVSTLIKKESFRFETKAELQAWVDGLSDE